MRARLVIPETPTTKAIVCGLCVYEVAAIATGRIPTITALHQRHPLIGVVLIAALVVHFCTPDHAKER